jgi:hypothetical protein
LVIASGINAQGQIVGYSVTAAGDWRIASPTIAIVRWS